MAKNLCPKCEGPIEIKAPNKKGLQNWKCKNPECGAGGYWGHVKKNGTSSKGLPVPEVRSKKKGGTGGSNEPAEPKPGTGAGDGSGTDKPWYDRGIEI